MKVYIIIYTDMGFANDYYGIARSLDDVDKKCYELIEKYFQARNSPIKREFIKSESRTQDGKIIINEDKLIWGYRYGKNNEYIVHDFTILIEEI